MNPLSRLLPFFVLFVCSCRTTSKDQYQPGPNPFFGMIQKELDRKTDSASNASRKRLMEPRIWDRDIETYVFYWHIDWHEDVLYRLEKAKSGKMSLTTKFFARETTGDSMQYKYKGRVRYLRSEELIDSTIQEVSKQQWDVFRDQLEGSYFRELGSPDHKFLHPDYLYLQAICYPRFAYPGDSLRYYYVKQDAPYPGSFTNAALYLCDISHHEMGRMTVSWEFEFYRPGTLKNLKLSWE